ncbi:MAG: ATP-binding cassette domain-containing protein, partial [Clostridium sp.]|nr:ATP-binding cassette domain-containing protein [Clostridium sp.]
KLGAIVESPIFFPYMSGRKNLQNLARLNPNMTRKEQLDKVEEALSIVGLQDRAKDKVKTYSLGMKQRLGIAQSLLNNPDIVILDEPSNGLDPIGMRELRELVLKLQEEKGITFFISSHLLDELQQMCNKLIVIREGSLIWKGLTQELLAKSHGSNRLEDAFVELMLQKERM